MIDTADGAPAPEEDSALPTSVAAAPTGGELCLPAERLAFLAPKLRALLADFQQLTALEQADLEPAFGLPDLGEAAGATR